MEACGEAVVVELEGSLGIDGGDDRVDAFGEDVNSEHETSSLVIDVARVTLDDHDDGGALEYGAGGIRGKELLLVCLLSR